MSSETLPFSFTLTSHATPAIASAARPIGRMNERKRVVMLGNTSWRHAAFGQFADGAAAGPRGVSAFGQFNCTEISFETPGSSIVTPYNRFAISMVRRLWVIR